MSEKEIETERLKRIHEKNQESLRSMLRKTPDGRFVPRNL
jgi:hypothetical protein